MHGLDLHAPLSATNDLDVVAAVLVARANRDGMF